ncbi:MAG: hypothetical protein R6V40_04325 [Candidatus Moraniibacteriota bacterium]
MLYETKFLISLFTTLAIELPVLLFLSRLFFKRREMAWEKVFFAGIIASSLTLPYLWFIFPAYIPLNYQLFLGEALVVIIEAVIYFYLLKIKAGKALSISFTCNAASFLMGLILF